MHFLKTRVGYMILPRGLGSLESIVHSDHLTSLYPSVEDFLQVHTNKLLEKKIISSDKKRGGFPPPPSKFRNVYLIRPLPQQEVGNRIKH